MSFGIVEVISFLLGLSGFGLQPNPKAPTVDQALEYAMPDADVVVHFDAGSVIPSNYKVLLHLADDPHIKASPELVKVVQQAVTQIEGARGIAKNATGIDVTTDINDATAFVRVTKSGEDPDFLVESHGKFTPAMLDKVAHMQGGKATPLANGVMLDAGKASVGITKSGVLLAGTTSLVKARVDAGWTMPSHAPGTNLAAAADAIAGKPVFAVVVTMSPAARAIALDGVGRGNFLSDLIARHKVAALAIYHDGIGWTWTDTSKSGFDAIATMSDGVLDVFRAGQIAPRGIAKIVIGGLDSYRSADKRIEELVRHKDDLMKIVSAFSGDGSFKVQFDKDPKTLALRVRATGKTFSEVVPLGAVIPMMAVGMLVMRGSAHVESSTMVMPVPAVTTPHR